MISFLATVLAMLLLLNILVYFQQPGMVYFPIKKLDGTPEDWRLSYEDITLTTEDGLKLNGWFIPTASAKKVVLFFHGNAGNISHRRESVEIFHELNLNVFIFDYRGFGSSEGRPGERGTYRDARAAWRYLVEQRHLEPDNIILFGRSLGGVIATKLATEVNAAGLIVESTFSSARAMASRVMPLLHYVLWERFDYNTAAYIKKVNMPVLVTHSPADEIIPYQQGRRIFEMANEPKTFLELRGDHNNGFYESGEVYIKGLRDFLN
ncbi:MAG: alpha/beta hydrolase [Gammaproteobacteria bacterium]|nr:MAG: alpha/beta hydrolase [Gammaproteobacteria bacterium]